MSEKKNIKLRNLKGKDVFRLSKIIKKMGLLEMNIDTENKSQKELGFEVIKRFVENMDKSETEINEFFGDLVGMSAEEFADQDISIVIDIIKSMQNLPGIGDFFQQAKELTK